MFRFSQGRGWKNITIAFAKMLTIFLLGSLRQPADDYFPLAAKILPDIFQVGSFLFEIKKSQMVASRHFQA